MHHAVLNNQIAVIRLLMKRVVDASIVNKDSKSGIDLAKEMNNKDILEMLCPDTNINVEPDYLS